MVLLSEIQANLIEAIKISKLTRVAIAEHLGINTQKLAGFLHGRKPIPLDIFATLCELLNANANEILSIKKN